MNIKLSKMILIFLVLTLIMVACSTDEESSNTESKKQQTESTNDNQESLSDDYKDELRIAVSSNPTTLDPHMTTAADALEMARNFFETLVALDENYEAKPMLAESIDISDDGLIYTFKLREGVYFHNGKEMTAEDVVASMNRWLGLSSKAQSFLQGAKFVEVDTYMVEMHLVERASDALDLLASTDQFPGIMPKEVIEEATETGISEFIGTGPFQFVEWKQDTYVHLRKYDNYNSLAEDPSGLVGRKEVFVEDLYYIIVPDAATKLTGLQTGEYDVADRLEFSYFDQVVNNDQFVSYVDNDNGTLNIFFNKKQGIMTNKKMRQAVNAIVNADSVLLASYEYEELYVKSPSYMSVNNKNWFTEAGKESYNQVNPEKAKQLLEEAGYKGETIRILSTRDYDFHYNTAIIVKEELDKIGVNAEVEIYDWPTLIEKRSDPANWDILTVAFTLVTTPSQLLFFNPEYPGWIEDEKVYDLLDKVRKAEQQAEATAYWEELQEYMWNDYMPHVMFGHTSGIVATSKNLEDFRVFRGPIPWNTKVRK